MNKYLRSSLILATLVGSGLAVADENIQQIYDTKCAVCHVSGVAGAPKLDDKEAWASRLEKGPEGLLASAKKGLGGMPPKGTCMDCSDEDLLALIKLMTAGIK